MTLIKDEYTIVNAQHVENLFTLDIVRENVIITVQNTLKHQQQD